jgi:chromate reductase
MLRRRRADLSSLSVSSVVDWSDKASPPADGLRAQEGAMTIHVGYFVGSLSSTSINRILSRALIRLAPEDMEFTELTIDNLPLYSPDYDDDYPAEPRALKAAIAAVDAVLFVTPEYNRSIPGALKNAIDWASRPWGENSFDHIPAAVIGASIGQIGTAMGQQSLRGVLSFCNARQMTTPEAYIQYSSDVFQDDGEVTKDSTREFLTAYMAEFRTYIDMVLTVLPRTRSEAGSPPETQE